MAYMTAECCSAAMLNPAVSINFKTYVIISYELFKIFMFTSLASNGLLYVVEDESKMQMPHS